MKFPLTCLKSKPFLVLEDQFVGGVEERQKKEKGKRKREGKVKIKGKVKKKREMKSERERERIEEASFSIPFTSFCRSKLDRPGVKVALREKNYTWYQNHKISAKAQGSGVDPQFCPSALVFILWVSYSPIILI